MMENEPNITQPQHNCPFYGQGMFLSFTTRGAAPFLLLGAGGNRCGLIVDALSPCILEADGQPVEWSACPNVKAVRIGQH